MDSSPDGGRFCAPPFELEIGDGYTPVRFETEHEFCIDDLEERFLGSGRVPVLDGAPVASWILARLAHLASGHLGLDESTVELCEDALWIVDFVVVRPDGTVVAKAQLQAGMVGLGLLGVASGPEVPERLARAFVDCIIAAPLELSPISVEVVDPEWARCPGAFDPRPSSSSSNRYGWTGSFFLGRGNIRGREPRPSSEAEP